MQTNNKQREALGKILWCLEWMFNNTDDKSVQSHLGEPIALAKSALAEPMRNYEVGTSEEQTERFKDLCRKYRRGPGPRANCKGCPIQHESLHVGCTFAWAQLPYEEGSMK